MSLYKYLVEDIDTALAKDPATRSRLEVIFCHAGFHARLWHRLSHALWNNGLKLLARITSMVSRLLTGIEIHPAAIIGRRFFIDHGMGVVIGETSTIGNDVTIYHDVTLGGIDSHSNPTEGVRHPTIEDGAIIGAGAQILGPVTIGTNARIGANAVVVHSVPEGCTAVGVPAHILDKRKLCKDTFTAYGTPQGEDDDPILTTLQSVQQQMEELQTRMTILEQQDDHTRRGEAV